MALAHYYLNGIPGSPVKADPAEARQLYFQVASTFGVSEAQFQLAKMILAGQGGKPDVLEAMKWLNHAARRAMSVPPRFSRACFSSRARRCAGLAYMTAALDHCQPDDKVWVQDLQEQAFFCRQRRSASQRATEWRSQSPSPRPTTERLSLFSNGKVRLCPAFSIPAVVAACPPEVRGLKPPARPREMSCSAPQGGVDETRETMARCRSSCGLRASRSIHIRTAATTLGSYTSGVWTTRFRKPCRNDRPAFAAISALSSSPEWGHMLCDRIIMSR